MKFGILYTSYNCLDYTKLSIQPFIRAKSRHDIEICAVSVPFAKFDCQIDSETPKYLKSLSELSHVIDEPKFVPETIARSMALTSLKRNGCNYVWQVDADEFYTDEDIDNIISYVKDEPFVDWFRICLKNYVFDEKSYLKEPFCPPRIHKTDADDFNTSFEFWDDNNIIYINKNTGQKFKDITNFSAQTIPESVAFVKHLTWLSDRRSKDKILYQRARLWQCSFDWDEKENKLIFNHQYYLDRGLNFPEILKDPS